MSGIWLAPFVQCALRRGTLPCGRAWHKPQTHAREPATQLGTPGYLQPVREPFFSPSFATLNSPGGPVIAGGWEGRLGGGCPARLPGDDAAAALRSHTVRVATSSAVKRCGSALGAQLRPTPPPPPAPACAYETGLPRWASRGVLADFMASCFCDE